MQEIAIQTQKLTRRFGKLLAVDAIDLQVTAGQFFGFLGPNGAGKSTTIKILTGLLAPTSGSMQLLGVDFAVNQVEGLGRGPNHAAKKLVHGVRLKLMLFSRPSLTSQVRSDSCGSRYFSGTKARGADGPGRLCPALSTAITVTRYQPG